MALVSRSEVDVEPDGGQWYLRTRDVWASDQPPIAFYEADDLLWSDGTFVVVLMAHQAGTTPVVVEVHDEEPPPADETWQHVALTSMASTGLLDLQHWGAGSAAMVEVPGGSIRLRAHWAGMDEPPDPQPEAHGEHMLIQVWSAPTAPTSVERRTDLFDVAEG